MAAKRSKTDRGLGRPSLDDVLAQLDAAEAAPLSPALQRDIVAGLRASFESAEPPLDVDDFLAAAEGTPGAR